MQQTLAALLLATSSSIWAGCVGPVIMGECHGKVVPWDTSDHGTDVQRREPDADLAPREGGLGEIPMPGLPGRDASPQGLDRFYGQDPRYSTPPEPQEHRGRFR